MANKITRDNTPLLPDCDKLLYYNIKKTTKIDHKSSQRRHVITRKCSTQPCTTRCSKVPPICTFVHDMYDVSNPQLQLIQVLRLVVILRLIPVKPKTPELQSYTQRLQNGHRQTDRTVTDRQTDSNNTMSTYYIT